MLFFSIVYYQEVSFMITARNIYHHTQNTNFLPLCPLILYECGGEKIIGRIFNLQKYGLSVGFFCFVT